MPAEFVGKSILEKHGKSDANEAVLHELRTRRALLHQENYHHSYPYCWRSKTPIIFRAMDQWFINLARPFGGKPFRQAALEEIARVAWVPEWGVNRIKSAVETRPDWCISRQRAWGVRLPGRAGGPTGRGPGRKARVERLVREIRFRTLGCCQTEGLEWPRRGFEVLRHAGCLD